MAISRKRQDLLLSGSSSTHRLTVMSIHNPKSLNGPVEDLSTKSEQSCPFRVIAVQNPRSVVRPANCSLK